MEFLKRQSRAILKIMVLLLWGAIHCTALGICRVQMRDADCKEHPSAEFSSLQGLSPVRGPRKLHELEKRTFGNFVGFTAPPEEGALPRLPEMKQDRTTTLFIMAPFAALWKLTPMDNTCIALLLQERTRPLYSTRLSAFPMRDAPWACGYNPKP